MLICLLITFQNYLCGESGDSPSISLTTNLDMLVVCEVDMLNDGVSIEWVEVEGREGSEHRLHNWVLGSGERRGRVGQVKVVVWGWGAI